MMGLSPEEAGQGAVQQRAFEPANKFRTVVFLLDSAGESEMFDPELMPFVTSMRQSSLSGQSRSCASKATFPCIKSIFEGREATMGTTLQDFSAFASSRTTWPASLAALGLRLVVASDHTLNRLYPHAFVDSLDYEDLHAPLLERDAFVYRKARQWLADPAIDVLVLHIIGTDKVSHEYPVRGPVYAAKYREVDDFIREVAGLLQPQDYLYAISDHGHNELGGHTEKAAYLARGPLFPLGASENLHAPDLLFLLSAPYGLTLPNGYEGQIRTDLLRLAPEARERWLSAQAKSWRVPVTRLSMDAAESRLNEHIAGRRVEWQRAEAAQSAWRLAPFWLATAFFLIGELPLRRARTRRRAVRSFQVASAVLGLALVFAGFPSGAWLLAVAAFVGCVELFGPARSIAFLLALGVLGAIAFWCLPAGLSWIHIKAHRPLGYAGFYGAAVLLGIAFARARSGVSWSQKVSDVAWIVGLAVWLLAYFGPLGYSLTRHGSLVLLTALVTALILLNLGPRKFISTPALILISLLPLAVFDVESFSIKYLLLDWLPQSPPALQVALCLSAVGLFAAALNYPQRLSLRTLVSVLFALAWAVAGSAFFQFDVAKLTGTLLSCLWLIGVLELFRRGEFPLRWGALVSAIFLFLLLTFLLNGFALSHVDFRFATHRIIQFQKEAFRAPQLIVWAAVKYAFGLLPALVVLQRSAAGFIWPQLLLLGWWRELIIVASALGLALFNAQGMGDLCFEEIYFWTFLNLVLGVACVLACPLRRIARGEATG